MIKLLAIREYIQNGEKKGYRTPLKPKIEVESVPAMFHKAQELANKIPENERFNIHYSLGHWLDEKGREFDYQEVIPFDFDDIDLDRINEYIPVICSTLGVNESDVAIVASGNGLHVILWTDRIISDPEYFAETRPHYKEVCRRLQLELYEHGLLAKVDTTLWCTGKSLRFPYTMNIKSDKGKKWCKLINGNMKQFSIDIVEMSGLPVVSMEDQVSEIAYKNNVDSKEVLTCPFIQHCITDAEDLPEPEWYAMLTVVSRLENGVELCHKFSEPYSGYNEAEVDAKIEYALNSTRPRTCKNISTLWDGCVKCPHFGNVASPIMLRGKEHIATESTGFYDVITDANGIEKRGKPNYDDLVKKFIQEYDYVVLNDTLFIYNGRCWDKINDRLFADRFAERYFNPKPNNKMCSEFKQKLYRMPDRGVDAEFFVTRGLANFKNGYLNTETGEFKEHDRNIGFTYCLPFDFDKEATCPTFDYFIEDICLGDKDLERLMVQFMGYVLCAADPNLDPKCLILTGHGSNGKSTYAELLCELCGDGNWSAVPLLDAVRKPESRVGMVGKLLNFSEEIPTNSMMDNSVFKNLVTGGVFTARNLYKDTIEVRNTAKLIMTCNHLPPHNDLSEGMRRRLLIVDLKGNYLRPQDYARLPEGFDSTIYKIRDAKIKRKMLEEASGIWNRAYNAYLEMIEDDGFTIPKVVDESVKEYMEENNPVAMWIKETTSIEVTNNPNDYVSVSDLYQSFRIDAELMGYERRDIPTKTKFSKTMLSLNLDGTSRSGEGAKIRRIDGKSTRVITGVKKL